MRTYQLFINGRFIAGGSLDFMNEVISDYLTNNKMYYKDEVIFRIVENKK